MTKSTDMRISTEDRERVFRYLRHHGVAFTRHIANGDLAVVLAAHLGQKLGHHYTQRIRFVKRFAAEQEASVARVIVPSRGVPVFRPLKMSREMRAALDRVKEIYPEREK